MPGDTGPSKWVLILSWLGALALAIVLEFLL